MVFELFDVTVHHIFQIHKWETEGWGGNLLFSSTPFCITCSKRQIDGGKG